MPGKGGGRRNSEDEQEQGKASQQLAVSVSGWNEGTPAGSLELDLPRVRGALGECGGAGKSKRSLSNSPSRLPMKDAWLGEL